MLFLLSGDIESNPGPELRIFQQNVCSLKNKLGTLRTHAGELTDYDAICLTETWLSHHVADSELQLGLPDFSWFRKDRGGRGGGVACAVKSRLSPVHRPDSESLVVQLGTTRSAFLAVCYRAPNSDRDGKNRRPAARTPPHRPPVPDGGRHQPTRDPLDGRWKSRAAKADRAGDCLRRRHHGVRRGAVGDERRRRGEIIFWTWRCPAVAL